MAKMSRGSQESGVGSQESVVRSREKQRQDPSATLGMSSCRGLRFRVTDLTGGLIHPSFKASLAESRIIARKQCSLADLCPRIKRIRVSDDLAEISEMDQAPLD